MLEPNLNCLRTEPHMSTPLWGFDLVVLSEDPFLKGLRKMIKISQDPGQAKFPIFLKKSATPLLMPICDAGLNTRLPASGEPLFGGEA